MKGSSKMWILVLLYSSFQVGAAFETIPNFKSKAACVEAANLFKNNFHVDRYCIEVPK